MQKPLWSVRIYLRLVLHRGSKEGNNRRLGEGANIGVAVALDWFYKGSSEGLNKILFKAWSTTLLDLRPKSHIPGAGARKTSPFTHAQLLAPHLALPDSGVITSWAPQRAAVWPHARDGSSGGLGSKPRNAALPGWSGMLVPSRPPSRSSHSAREPSGARDDLGSPDTLYWGPPRRGRWVHPAEDAPNFGPEPARLCAPHSRPPRQEWAPKLSASTLQEPGTKACTGGPRRLPGRPLPRGRTKLAPAADATAKVPSKLGGERPAARGWREEGRSASAAETASRGSSARPSRGAAPTCGARAAGRGNLRGGGGFLGLGRSWHHWRLGRREGRRAWVRTAPSPGTRRRDSRWPGRGGARRCRSGCVAAQAGRHRWAGGLRPLGLSPGPYFWFSLLPEFQNSTALT